LRLRGDKKNKKIRKRERKEGRKKEREIK